MVEQNAYRWCLRELSKLLRTKTDWDLALELQVKQVCDGAGASVIQIPFYLCFGREMWSLLRKELSGEAMAKEAALLMAKWKARGLVEAVLQGIRTDGFSVATPIAP